MEPIPLIKPYLAKYRYNKKRGCSGALNFRHIDSHKRLSWSKPCISLWSFTMLQHTSSQDGKASIISSNRDSHNLPSCRKFRAPDVNWSSPDLANPAHHTQAPSDAQRRVSRDFCMLRPAIAFACQYACDEARRKVELALCRAQRIKKSGLMPRRRNCIVAKVYGNGQRCRILLQTRPRLIKGKAYFAKLHRWSEETD